MTHNQLFDALAEADPFQSWWPFIVAVAVGVVMTVRTFMAGQPCPSSAQLDGHVIIVTGCSGGIGLEIVRELCRRRATVIMACRNLPKAQAALHALQRVQPDAVCEVRHLDLSSLASVRYFACGIQSDFRCVHALINNAGVMLSTATGEQRTADGFEIHLQVNYLAGVLLSELLSEQLSRCGGRVVNTAAHAYAAAGQFVSSDDPLNVGEWKRAYHHRDAFALSKLLVVLWSQHHKQQQCPTEPAEAQNGDDAAKVAATMTVNAYTPGFVRGTDHLRQSPIMRSMCAKTMIYPWMWTFMKTPVQGAQTAVYMVSEPTLAGISGKYLNDCEATELAAFATDERLVAKVYEETRRVLEL